MSFENPLFSLIEQVAQHLPSEWRFNYRIDEHNKFANPQIIGLNGKKINFRGRFDAKQMVSVTGTWPKIFGDDRYSCVRHWGVMNKNEHYPTINFSVTRKPSAIANDIQKRFLVNYQDFHQRCLVKREKTISHRENVKFKIQALNRVYPLTENVHRHNPDRPKLYLSANIQKKIGGEIRFNPNDSFDANLLNLPLDKVISILAVLNSE